MTLRMVSRPPTSSEGRKKGSLSSFGLHRRRKARAAGRKTFARTAASAASGFDSPLCKFTHACNGGGGGGSETRMAAGRERGPSRPRVINSTTGIHYIALAAKSNVLSAMDQLGCCAPALPPVCETYIISLGKTPPLELSRTGAARPSSASANL